MSSFKEKYGEWAIVAGAAEGLGEAYSTALARRNINLVMVDNQRDKMEKLADKLEQEHQVITIRLHLDLSEENVIEKVMKKSADLDVGLLVYNAAYSLIKPFIKHTPDELDNFIEVNTRKQLQMVHAFSKSIIDRSRPGGILLMSSLTGMIGMQLVAPYSATKAFARTLAESLNHELKPHNIDIMACVAGLTSTPALLKSNPDFGFTKPFVMKPETVAESTLKSLGKKTLFIPGTFNRVNYFILSRLLPRKVATSIANRTMAKMYRHISLSKDS
jgi:short-subunit dehydrogenase